MRHVGGVLFALVITGALFGCKSESSEEGAGGPVDEATFKSSLAADHCARVKDCCGMAQQSFDQALCEKQFAAATFGASGGAGGGAASGSASAIAYDGAAAAECLASLKAKAQTCASLFGTGDEDAPTGGPIRLRDACSRVFHGSKKVGEACASSLECAPGDKGFAYCNPALAPSGGSGTATGACEEVSAGAGQCGEQSGGGSPRFFVCMPEGDKVMPCENGYCAKIWHEGDKCRDFSDGKCEAGLTCQNPGADGWGTCTGQPHAGSPCQNGACAQDAYCDGGSCVARKAAGQACQSANECLAPASACEGGVCAVPAGQMCTMGH